MNASGVYDYYCYLPHPQRRYKSSFNNMLVWEVVGEKVGELEEEVMESKGREVFTRWMRK